MLPIDALRRACADLDRRLRAGEPVRAEDYFLADPGLAASPDDAVELVYAEFVARANLGQNPSPDTWLGRFPQWERDLRELFQIHELMRDGLDAGPATDAPRRLRHFDLFEEVGRGSEATVYKARDRRLGRLVALKVLRPAAVAPDASKLFGEGGAAARLQHPNIVPVYEIGEADGHLFLALEFLPGGTLRDRAGGRPMAPREAASVVEVIARAVHYAHLMGVVHRDLKPANVLLTADGVPKVADFGLAKVGTRAEAGGVVVGTPGYMAPEQARGEGGVGPAADVYALGAILRDLLAGRAPPSGQPPRDLAAVCGVCLRPDPAGRYPDAAALADDLRRFLNGDPVTARPVGPLERGWKFARRRPAAAALLAVTTAGVVSALAGVVRYNARLQVEIDRAENQNRMYREQLDVARRNAYAVQLSQVDAVRRDDPVRGRQLLDDPAACPPDLRDFTWRYLRRSCGRERLSADCRGSVERVCYSPDGAAVATVSRVPGGNVVAVWDATTGGQRCRLAGADRPVAGLAFTPDGRTLVVARRPGSAGSGVVHLHDPATGEEVAPARPLVGPAIAVGCTADGPVLAVATEGGNRPLAIRTPGPLPVWSVFGASGAEFAPDGLRLATWGHGGAVTVWDGDGRRVAELSGAEGSTRAAAFSPDGTLFAAACGREVTVWDVETGRVRTVLNGHTSPVRCLAFSPDGGKLATGGEDFAVRLWDTDRGVEVGTLKGHGHIVGGVAFAPDGRTFATGGADGTVRVWEAEPGGPVVLEDGPRAKVLVAAASADGRLLASGRANGAVAVWDVPQRRTVARLAGHAGPVWAAAFSPDARRLATAGADGTVRLWEVASGAERTKLVCRDVVGSSPGPNALAAAFTPTGDRLFTAHQDGRLRVWDPADGRLIDSRPAHDGGALCVAVSADGGVAATGGEDGRIQLWDVATWRPTRRLAGHGHWVTALGFDPTGRWLASGGKDRTVRLWELGGAGEPVVCDGHTHWVYAVAFSPDGRTLVSGTADRMSNAPGEVKFWDPATGRARFNLAGRSAPVLFAGGGAVLVSADLGGKLFLDQP